jgi:hypothetical protein
MESYSTKPRFKIVLGYLKSCIKHKIIKMITKREITNSKIITAVESYYNIKQKIIKMITFTVA